MGPQDLVTKEDLTKAIQELRPGRDNRPQDLVTKEDLTKAIQDLKPGGESFDGATDMRIQILANAAELFAGVVEGYIKAGNPRNPRPYEVFDIISVSRSQKESDGSTFRAFGLCLVARHSKPRFAPLVVSQVFRTRGEALACMLRSTETLLLRRADQLYGGMSRRVDVFSNNSNSAVDQALL